VAVSASRESGEAEEPIADERPRAPVRIHSHRAGHRKHVGRVVFPWSQGSGNNNNDDNNGLPPSIAPRECRASSAGGVGPALASSCIGLFGQHRVRIKPGGTGWRFLRIMMGLRESLRSHERYPALEKRSAPVKSSLGLSLSLSFFHSSCRRDRLAATREGDGGWTGADGAFVTDLVWRGGQFASHNGACARAAILTILSILYLAFRVLARARQETRRRPGIERHYSLLESACADSHVVFR